jgi:hypothetical protein
MLWSSLPQAYQSGYVNLIGVFFKPGLQPGRPLSKMRHRPEDGFIDEIHQDGHQKSCVADCRCS